MQFNYLTTLCARLALSHSNPQQAVDILAVAGPYELGLPACSSYNWPNLYPVYVRGEAYSGVPTPCPATRPKLAPHNQDFLTLWKDADPDIPGLKQAKAEYSKLHALNLLP